MATLNALLRSLFDILLAPFQGMPAWVPLLLISIVTAVFALIVYKYLSNQDQLERVKDRMFAGIFEIRLYNDSLPLIFKATGSILANSLRYFWLAFWPAMLVIMVPIVLVIAQLQFHYGLQGFEPGDTVLLEVDLEPPAGQETFEIGASKPTARLELPQGVAQDTPPVWIPTENRLVWRLSAAESGSYELGVTVAGESTTKSLVVSDSVVRRSPVRVDTTFWKQLLYPAEAPLPGDSGIAEIRLDYPGATVPFLFIDWNWLILYIVLMIVIGFALAKPMKVTV
jgi:hypothetical protein